VNREEFQDLPTNKVKAYVQKEGPHVCVFPINGTRRWFLLEHGDESSIGPIGCYLETTWRRQLELYQLIFNHGIHTLLTPIFGPDLLTRDETYKELILPGLTWFAKREEMIEFYAAYDVRVRVYGDTERYLSDTPYAPALDAFESIQAATASHQSHRLLFGICAHDSTQSVAEIGARFYQAHGHPPDREDVIEAYYGEFVEPVDLFIGFDRPAAFDMPLVATGDEDLYFTVAPSPYLDQETLRTILYDHLFTRHIDESSYALVPEQWQRMREFYRLNRRHVLGIGIKRHGVWYPLPQVKLPPDFEDHVTGR